MVTQGLRRIRISNDGRNTTSKNSSFLQGNRIAGMTKPAFMINGNAGNDRNIGVNHIHSIQATSEPELSTIAYASDEKTLV